MVADEERCAGTSQGLSQENYSVYRKYVELLYDEVSCPCEMKLPNHDKIVSYAWHLSISLNNQVKN